MDLSGLQVQKHLLFEHIDPANQLVHRLAALLADTFVVSKYILGTYVRKAQVIEKESLEFLSSVVIIYLHQVFPVLGIMEEVLKVVLCQYHLIFYALIGYQLCLIYVLTCPGELLQFQIGLILVR